MEERNKRITVSLTGEMYEALRKFAFDGNVSLSAALSELCGEGLERKSYLEADKSKQEESL